MSESAPARPSILFVWGQFGPYHQDRCKAAAGLPNHTVMGLEIANNSSHHYAWDPIEASGFTKITLFPGKTYEEAGRLNRLLALVREGVRAGARYNFLCHYDQLEIFILATVLRFLRRRVFIMWESKFDDRPRSLWREMLKWVFLRPYTGVLNSGIRSRAYLAFLGMAGRPIANGYDSISVERLRAQAGSPAAPDGASFRQREFLVIARLVAKKNLSLVIAAYDLYRRNNPENARNLVFLGTGPLDAALKAEVSARGLSGIRFAGFVQAEGVAHYLSHALALILPSIEEQWGLVVNEALALGVPVLCSENVGARDDLVRDTENGYVFAEYNAEHLADLMGLISGNETRWRAMATASSKRADLGDTSHFADGVRALIAAAP
jgi:glycosyltransferase involved in cell wall biosynthesis